MSGIIRDFDSDELFQPFINFKEEAKWLRENGMPEEMIEDFKTSAIEAIRDDQRYNRHNLSLFDEEGKEPQGTFAYQRGSQRKKSKAEMEDKTGWCSIKMCIKSLGVYDNYDVYIETVDIVEQLGSWELQRIIDSMPERRRLILELKFDGWDQKRIAQRLGISEAAVCKHVKAIEVATAPYYQENHWLKVNF